MELSIANHGNNEPITDLKKDKVFSPNVDKIGKKPANKAFIVNTTPIKTFSTPIKISSKNKANEIKRGEPSCTQDKYKKHLEGTGAEDVPFS
ncbi:hypothetical protein ACFX10_019526 [Malus domestica]